MKSLDFHRKEWKPFPNIKEAKKKLKIVYVSPDFKKHPAQNFLLPTLAHHDHQKFKIYAFAEVSKEDQVLSNIRTMSITGYVQKNEPIRN